MTIMLAMTFHENVYQTVEYRRVKNDIIQAILKYAMFTQHSTIEN